MVREPRLEDPGQTIVLSVSAAFWRKLQRGVDQCFFREGEERAARETARLLQLAAGLQSDSPSATPGDSGNSFRKIAFKKLACRTNVNPFV